MCEDNEWDEKKSSIKVYAQHNRSGSISSRASSSLRCDSQSSALVCVCFVFAPCSAADPITQIFTSNAKTSTHRRTPSCHVPGIRVRKMRTIFPWSLVTTCDTPRDFKSPREHWMLCLSYPVRWHVIVLLPCLQRLNLCAVVLMTTELVSLQKQHGHW